MKYFVFSFFLLISCTDSGKILPGATGESSELIFVVDDYLWKNSIDSLSSSIFGSTIKGVIPEEPLFRIIQVNNSEFKSVLKRHKNVIIVAKGVNKSFQKNKWSIGQFVAQINWDGDPQKLLNEFIKLRNLFTAKEVKSLRSSFEILSQKKGEKILLSNFGVECVVPQEYHIIKNDSTLFWANYNSSKSDEIKNILIFSFIPKIKKSKEEILIKVDSIFKQHLVGQKEGSYARIEKRYTPYYFDNTYRGLWKLEKGFMGGPFIVKTYFITNKTVVNIGMVFAPQKSKRKYIKEFEAIL